ncbi:MAG: glycosyltransferase family 2 protein [Polyangiales bacterium]
MGADERVLLFIPAYNCERQIARVLRKLGAAAPPEVDAVLVVDNRSTDGTVDAALAGAEALAGVPVTVLRNRENYGLGGSTKVAFEFAAAHGYAWVLGLHGDDQGDLGDLLPLMRAGRHRGLDALLGARFHPGSRLVGYSLPRTIANHVFNALYSAAAGRRLLDLGSGINLYRVAPFAGGFHRRFPDDLTFNYCLALAHVRLGHRTEFFPIRWAEEDQVSNVRVLRQTAQVFAIVLSYLAAPDAFLAGEHRARPRDAYPYETLRAGAEAGAPTPPRGGG